MTPYSLDLADDTLRKRETFVLARVMTHIAEWDRMRGSKHTVIGVQLDNEVRGIKSHYPSALVISYMSDLGAAVKTSPYVVWTRLNCVSTDANSRIDANSTLRHSKGTNIDFVGTDLYRVGAPTMRVSLSPSLD